MIFFIGSGLYFLMVLSLDQALVLHFPNDGQLS